MLDSFLPTYGFSERHKTVVAAPRSSSPRLPSLLSLDEGEGPMSEWYDWRMLDRFLPEYEFSERHETVVRAPREVVRRAAEEWRPSESWLWRPLLVARGLGAPKGTLRQWAESMGFVCLADSEDEFVYAQAGRFWSLRERAALVSPRTPEELLALDDPRAAVAAMSIRIEPLAPDRTRLVTETRVHALGPQARRRFRLYWLLIRPFSGLLRRSMLAGIKKRAER